MADMELSGSYVTGVMKCISKPDGGLEPARQLTEQLGVDGLDSLIAFAESPLGGEAGDRPVMLASLTAIDRGMYNAGAQVAGFVERFENLQGSLGFLDPVIVFRTLAGLEKKGVLESLLTDLVVVLDSLESGSLEALTVKWLADSELRAAVSELRSAFFEDEVVFSALSRIFTVNQMRLLSQEGLLACGSRWLERSPKGVPNPSCQSLVSGLAATDGVREFKNFWQALGTASQQRLVASFRHILMGFMELDGDERLMAIAKTRDFVTDLWRQNENPLATLVAVLSRLSSLHSSQVSTLFKVVETMNEDAQIAVLERQVGRTRLIRELEDLLIYGGPVPGCDLVLPGLLGRELSSPELLAAKLRSFMQERPEACAGHAPLSAAVEHKLGVRVEPFYIDWSGPQEWQVPEPMLLQKLATAVLARVLKELATDPYYLWAERLANGAVSVAPVSELLAELQQLEGLTPAGVVELDLTVSASGSAIKDHFLETLLGREVERLAAISAYFSGLLPNWGSKEKWQQDPAVEHKLMGVMLGIYPGGPGGQVLRQVVANVAASAPPGLSAHNSSELRRVLRDARLFKHPAFFNKGEDVRYSIVGEKPRLSVSLGADGFGLRAGANLGQAVAYTSWSGSGYGVWSELLKSPHFLTKDVDEDLADATTNWLGSEVLEKVNRPSTWQAAFDSADKISGIDPSFFVRQAYNPMELMALLFYYQQNFSEPTAVFPQELSAGQPTFLLGHGHLFGRNRDFRGFYSLWSQLFNALGQDASLDLFASYLAQPLNGQPGIIAEPSQFLEGFEMVPALEKGLGGLVLLNLLSESSSGLVPAPGVWSPHYIRSSFLAVVCPVLHRLHQGLWVKDAIETCAELDGVRIWRHEGPGFAPAAFADSLLGDLFHLGKNPQLAPGLSTLSAQIRLARTNALRADSIRSFLKVGGPVVLKSQARSYYQVARARNFWFGGTSFIDIAIESIRREHSVRSSFEDAVKNYGYRDRYRLKDILDSVQASYAQHKHHTLMVLLLDIMQNLTANEAYIEIILDLLSAPASIGSAEVMGDILPLITRIKFFPGFRWHWHDHEGLVEDPGIQLVKTFTAKESLDDINLMISTLGRENIASMLSATFSAKGSLAMLGDLDPRAATLEKLAAFLFSWGTATSENVAVLDSVNKDIGYLVGKGWEDSLFTSAHRLLMSLKFGDRGLKGKDMPAPLTSFEPMMLSAFDKLPQAMRSFQKHQPDGRSRQLILAIGKVFDSDSEQASALLSFLGDERLGFSGKKIWLDMLRNIDSRQAFRKSLLVFDQVESGTLKAFVGGMPELLTELRFLIHYGAMRAEFFGPLRKLYNYGFMVLDDQSQLSNEKLFKNVGLFSDWLERHEVEK